MIARAISEDVVLAERFLSTLSSPAESWSAKFEAWADELQLGPDLRRAVRVATIRLRTFGAIRRHRPRGRR